MSDSPRPPRLPRVSINEITTQRWSFAEDVEAYARLDAVQGIGVWRDKLGDTDVGQAAKRVRDAGMTVTSLSYAGMFTQGIDKQIEDGRRAIEQAKALGTDTLLVIAGPRLGVDLLDGDRLTREGLEALAPDSEAAGVTLSLEPLHPMDVTKWSTVVTITQALDLIEGIRGVKLMFDTWNTWWDPEVGAGIQRTGGLGIQCIQVADWQHPADNPRDRVPPGEGVAPLSELLGMVKDAGYEGWYEVEIMSKQYGPSNYGDLLRRCVGGLRDVLP